MVFLSLGIQSTDHGALIGGIVGGIFFLGIMAIVLILVAKKRRQSYAGMKLPFLLSILLLNSIQYNAQLPFMTYVQILFFTLMLALLENYLAKSQSVSTIKRLTNDSNFRNVHLRFRFSIHIRCFLAVLAY